MRRLRGGCRRWAPVPAELRPIGRKGQSDDQFLRRRANGKRRGKGGAPSLVRSARTGAVCIRAGWAQLGSFRGEGITQTP
eukprot:scaffold778_cov263-Pinguiococcus_pyrenoidosus.AAC.7